MKLESMNRLSSHCERRSQLILHALFQISQQQRELFRKATNLVNVYKGWSIDQANQSVITVLFFQGIAILCKRFVGSFEGWSGNLSHKFQLIKTKAVQKLRSDPEPLECGILHISYKEPCPLASMPHFPRLIWCHMAGSNCGLWNGTILIYREWTHLA